MNNGIGNGEYFKEHYGNRDWRFYRNQVATFIKNSEPGALLDIGAGCGFFLEACKKWGIPCSGLEGSPEAVCLAQQRCSVLDIRLHRLNEKFPFENNTFTGANINQVIEHLEPEVAANTITEVFRVLKPGGMLMVTSPSTYNKKVNDSDPTHINTYLPNELVKLLIEKGFVRIITNNSPFYYLGNSRIGIHLMLIFFKLFPIERLSSTANCIAYKPN